MIKPIKVDTSYKLNFILQNITPQIENANGGGVIQSQNFAEIGPAVFLPIVPLINKLTIKIMTEILIMIYNNNYILIINGVEGTVTF